MIVKWYVEDGYANHGTQITEINDAELAACENDEEREELIEKCIQADFEDNIYWVRI